VCFFGVVVLLSWWLVNGSSDKEYCYFPAILHSSNHQLVCGHIYITTFVHSRGVKNDNSNGCKAC
jgi:hypothetical protein